MKTDSRRKDTLERPWPTIRINGMPILHEDEPIAPTTYVNGVPILFEDITESEMGETNAHVLTNVILFVCLQSFLAERHAKLRVFANMNLYYHLPNVETDAKTSAAPDSMIVEPFKASRQDFRSYEIGLDGPAPLLTAEVMSARTAKKRDLLDKAALYAALRVKEYVLIDTTGQFLRHRLLLKRLQRNGSWKDETDPDGGITSKLGFRLVVEADGQLRLLDAKTRRHYVRPDEAEAKILELQAALTEVTMQLKQQERRKLEG